MLRTWMVGLTTMLVTAAPALGAATIGIGSPAGTDPFYVSQSTGVQVPVYLTLDAEAPISGLFLNMQIGELTPQAQVPVAGTPEITSVPTVVNIGSPSLEIGQSGLSNIESNQVGMSSDFQFLTGFDDVTVVPAGSYNIGALELDTSGAAVGQYDLSWIESQTTNGRANLEESAIFTTDESVGWGSPGALPEWSMVDYVAGSVVVASADLDGNGVVNALDIDELAAAAAANNNSAPFDINGDGETTFRPNADPPSDSDILIRQLFGTEYGDATLDLKVDFLDVSALSSGIGAGTGGWSVGNFNGDDLIDFLDVSLLSSTVGFDASNGNAVPEPTTFTLLLMGLSLTLCESRQRRQG